MLNGWGSFSSSPTQRCSCLLHRGVRPSERKFRPAPTIVGNDWVPRRIKPHSSFLGAHLGSSVYCYSYERVLGWKNRWILFFILAICVGPKHMSCWAHGRADQKQRALGPYWADCGWGSRMGGSRSCTGKVKTDRKARSRGAWNWSKIILIKRL